MSTPTLTQSGIFATVKPEYSNNAIASGLASGLLTADYAALIREFIAEKRASVGICTGRVNMLCLTLVSWRRFIGPYQELAIGDVYTGIDALKSGNSQKGKPFKQKQYGGPCGVSQTIPALLESLMVYSSYYTT